MNVLWIRQFASVKFFSNWKICCNSYASYHYDVLVIGGGIIGTAIAKTIKESTKDIKMALIEKESDFAQHQSCYNSQVIHAGIYYKSKTLKAKLCAEGANLIYSYCDFKKIPATRYGKLIIGRDPLDKFRLKTLYTQGVENNVSGLELLDEWKEVNYIQPNCKGLHALWSPNSGNTDWKLVTKSFGNDFKNEGGDIFFNCEATSIKESTDPSFPLIITEATKTKTLLARYVIVCMGLHSGTLVDSDKDKYKNISLRVNYYLLNPMLHRFIKTNIYAMPHLDMPFLGAHFSPTVTGSVLLGPSAVPDLKLNGYTQTSYNLNYIKKHVLSKGFGLLFLKNFRSCLNQFTETICSDVRASALNKYFPMLSKHDILPGPSCVQGQVITSDGEFVDDFLIETFEGSGIRKRIINCRFIPSPGATASLAIAQKVNSEITPKLNN